MPAQTGKSGILSKIKGVNEAVLNARNNETKYSAGGDLPPGIEGGVAQLRECKIGTYQSGDMEGQAYFLANGRVISPKTHNGSPVAGGLTQIGPEPICDTPNRSRKTVKDHIDWVVNELQKLGIDTSVFKRGGDDIELACAAIKKQQPYFKFRTWVGQATTQFPNPRTQHDWRGVTEEPEGMDEAAAGAVEEETPDDDIPFEESSEAQSEPQEEIDLEQLASDADSGDKKAVQRLTQLALDSGLDESAVNDAGSWSDVVGMMNGKHEEAEPEELNPQITNVFKYFPIDPKTKKPSKRGIEAEVVWVSNKSRLVTLRNMDTHAMVMGPDKKPLQIKWEDLHPA